MATVYAENEEFHLKIKKGDVGRYVLLCGDPGRCEKIAAYFEAHIRPDGLTDSDFCQPEGEERIDNMAGAIAACGLLELGKTTGEDRWRQAAEKLVNGMLDHCADWTPDRCGILTRCTASYHDDGAGRHTNIVYGDYFLTEALMKLTGRDPMLWL